ncbi:hypothetical protein Micbo1qcDRAFT_214043 [Microdochium bolleyi]|uniref:BTB domain-containing protein n=1 Tax=Microdochium bolleyi TaxID=196109 RepID=A0A136IVF8_9PEZI|nr:hypothetical protein Micbo1qcDRAFT_214043 [Microdochium bolleyi]
MAADSDPPDAKTSSPAVEPASGDPEHDEHKSDRYEKLFPLYFNDCKSLLVHEFILAKLGISSETGAGTCARIDLTREVGHVVIHYLYTGTIDFPSDYKDKIASKSIPKSIPGQKDLTDDQMVMDFKLFVLMHVMHFAALRHLHGLAMQAKAALGEIADSLGPLASLCTVQNMFSGQNVPPMECLEQFIQTTIRSMGNPRHWYETWLKVYAHSKAEFDSTSVNELILRSLLEEEMAENIRLQLSLDAKTPVDARADEGEMKVIGLRKNGEDEQKCQNKEDQEKDDASSTG